MARGGSPASLARLAPLLAALSVALGAGLCAEEPVWKAAGWSERVPGLGGAREWFVGPEGKAVNAGSREAPWDLASALAGARPVSPGDIVWVRGGRYRGKFEVKLRGKEGAPVHVRAYPGERATVLDSGLVVVEPAAFLWMWDLEIAGSVPPEKRETKVSGSHPQDLPGGDGLNVHAGEGCKFLNLWIHDNVGGGVGFWLGATGSEFHGCVIQGNGWRGPDRGHGHSIYAQNRDGVKTISGCIMSVPFDGSYTMHAYGSSKAYVDNFLLEENIACRKGPFLVGGGRPSHGIRVLRNYLHGVDLRLGYGAENEDCEVRDNVVARGKISIEKFRKAVKEGNTEGMPERMAVVILNRYDPRRAHLAVYNGARAPAVAAAVAPFLKPGDRFRLHAADDPFGKPLLEDTCRGPEISVPLQEEFGAFLLLRESGSR